MQSDTSNSIVALEQRAERLALALLSELGGASHVAENVLDLVLAALLHGGGAPSACIHTDAIRLAKAMLEDADRDDWKIGDV